MVLFAVALIK